MKTDKPQTPQEPLGFTIPALNLIVTASPNMVAIKYANGKPIPQVQQVAILNRIRDAFLSALIGPAK